MLATNLPRTPRSNDPVPVLDRLRTTRMPAPGTNATIMDAAGRVLYRGDAWRLRTGEGLDVSSFGQGTYFLRIEGDGSPVVRRFVKL